MCVIEIVGSNICSMMLGYRYEMTRLASTYISYNLSASAFTSFLFAEVASETCLTAYKFAFRYPKKTINKDRIRS
jgi:hypothetical protein